MTGPDPSTETVKRGLVSVVEIRRGEEGREEM